MRLKELIDCQHGTIRSGEITTFNAKPIVYDGKTFASKRALSSYFGIPYKTFHSRLKRGWSLEDAIKRSLSDYGFEYDGKTFRSHQHFAQFYKLNYGTHVSRMRKGWKLNESINPSMRVAKNARITHKGKVFNTIKEFAKTYRLSYSSVAKRLSEGWTAEECIDPSIRQEVKLSHDGIDFHSLKEFSKHHNLHYGNTCRRHRSGWSLHECINPSIRKRPVREGLSITVEDETYESIKEAALHFGVNAANVRARLQRGWTVEQAFAVKKPPKQKVSGKPCIFLGKTFRSRKSRDLFYNSPTWQIEKRLARGWTERQAVGLDPKPHRFRTAGGRKRAGGWRDRETIDGRQYPKTSVGEYKLYEIRNSINNKVYIGITISSLQARLRGHRRSAVRLNENNKFHNAMRKYGIDNFTIHLIRNDATSFKELGEQEIAEIASRKTIENGYNAGKGGDLGNAKPIMIDGVLYASYASAAEYFGVDDYLFNQRMSAGKSPEEAAGIVPPERPYSFEIIVGEKTYRSLQQACIALGLSYKMVWNRMNKSGWTERQALEIDPPPKIYEKYKKRSIDIHGKKFSSQNEMAKFLNISPAVISKRIRDGASYESIFEHFKDQKGRRRG